MSAGFQSCNVVDNPAEGGDDPVVVDPRVKTAEELQAQRIRLLHRGRRGQPVAYLSEHHAAHHRQHQPTDHLQHIVSRPRADGFIDEPPTEPYHHEAEQHLPDTHHDAQRRIPANAPRVLPQPSDVIHLYSMTSTCCHSAMMAATS